MIEVEISDDVFVKARRRAIEKGSLRGSIMDGGGNLAGFIGELIFAEHINGKIVDTFDYDIISPSGDKIDVKTKLTGVEPLPHYNCSVADYYHQKCDFYAFVRVSNVYSVAWILGYKDPKTLMSEGKFVKKGTRSSSNGFVARCDSYAMPIQQLDTDYDKFIRTP